MTHLSKFAGLLSLTFAATSVVVPAAAQTVRWDTGTYGFKEFSCTDKGITELVIAGTATLLRDDDTNLSAKPKLIKVTCPAMRFLPGGEIQTASQLLVSVDVLGGERPLFRGTRGIAGADAQPTPDKWQVGRAADGTHGRMGRPHGEKNGSDICKDGRDGGDGEHARHGHGGQPGPEGDPGEQGLAGADITVAVGTFETGKEVLEILSPGGEGGSGGKGGRGFNGGHGGNGGSGGNGGDAECGHAGAHGGRGGNGGNGGNGGDGGAGGDGGDGGAGGDITFGLVQDGIRPSEHRLFTKGGRGGAPGLGGDRGTGGKGGVGGNPGNGGQGWFKNGGKGVRGRDGLPGKDGVPGPIGRAGAKGPDGQQGGTGTWNEGPITPEILQRLKDVPVG